MLLLLHQVAGPLAQVAGAAPHAWSNELTSAPGAKDGHIKNVYPELG
jgi:hypothetical protein